MRRLVALFLASNGPGVELPCRDCILQSEKLCKVRLRMSSLIQMWSVGDSSDRGTKRRTCLFQDIWLACGVHYACVDRREPTPPIYILAKEWGQIN
jgi:hypothetical protein